MVAPPPYKLSIADLTRERPDGADEDVHFTEALAAFVIDSFSREGAKVLDPFAGYGTTLVVAERLRRTALGVELLPARVALIRGRLTDKTCALEGDARALARLDIGNVDLCLTSPPYMNSVDHPENPLTGYLTRDASYPRYLSEMSEVFAAVAEHLRSGGVVVLNAADVRTGDFVTRLGEDIARAVKTSLRLVDVILAGPRELIHLV